MSNNKNHYCIVHRKNGTLLVQDGRLPIYWLRKVAVEQAKLFPKYKVVPIGVRELNDIINNVNYEPNGR